MSEQSVGERLERLREQSAADYPETWTPTEQDPVIAGELVRLEHGHTRFGRKGIVILRDPDGTEHSVWLLNEVLQNQFQRAAPDVGDLVCIRWKGKRSSADGKNEYDDFRVVVDQAGAAIDWSGLGAAPATNGEQDLDEASRSLEHQPAGSPPAHSSDEPY